MALREQPYLPLYVQDFLTDEKLNECSAESTGVYIRLMCIMDKAQMEAYLQRIYQRGYQAGVKAMAEEAKKITGPSLRGDQPDSPQK